MKVDNSQASGIGRHSGGAEVGDMIYMHPLYGSTRLEVTYQHEYILRTTLNLAAIEPYFFAARLRKRATPRTAHTTMCFVPFAALSLTVSTID